MLSVKEAMEVAKQLQGTFEDVTVHGAREPITITARGHLGLKPRLLSACPCTGKVRRSRNVTAGMRTDRNDGKRRLCQASDNFPPRSFDEVVVCHRCDAVLHYEEATGETLSPVRRTVDKTATSYERQQALRLALGLAYDEVGSRLKSSEKVPA